MGRMISIFVALSLVSACSDDTGLDCPINPIENPKEGYQCYLEYQCTKEGSDLVYGLACSPSAEEDEYDCDCLSGNAVTRSISVIDDEGTGEGCAGFREWEQYAAACQIQE